MDRTSAVTRITALASAALVTLLGASAAWSYPQTSIAGSDVWASADPPFVSGFGGPGNSRVYVTWDPVTQELIYRDEAGVATRNALDPAADPLCHLENEFTARCPGAGRSVGSYLYGGNDHVVVAMPDGWRAVVSGGSGADVLEVVPARGTSSLIWGDAGADRITGGSLGPGQHGGRRDYLLGGTGQDRIRGELGNDRINGDSGHDDLFGGAGDDYLRAADGQRDEIIDCGGGDDVAVVDPGLDPHPRGCETVRSG